MYVWIQTPGKEPHSLLSEMENENKENEREEYKEIPPGDTRRFIFDTRTGVYVPVKD